MSCPYPIKIQNKYYGLNNKYFNLYSRDKYYYVPCGKCLSCRIAKTQWLNDACEWEYNHYGIGSFTTLTYDDENYLDLWNVEKERFEPNYKHIQDFFKRLRENLYRKYGFRKDFKYLIVCEIGEQKGRIHYHVLFFGLDYKNNDMDIYSAWNRGIVDNRPIMAGAIRYVLKYMTKDVVAFREKYDIGKKNRMFKYSNGLGRGFIQEHLDEIIKNNGCYDNGSGKLKSLPPYWLNKLRLKTLTNYNPIRIQMSEEHYDDSRSWKEYSRTEVLNWQKRKAQIKEKSNINKARDNGNAQEDFDTEKSNTSWNEKI